MSRITDMIIFTAWDEPNAMARLNAWCAEDDRERGQQFERIDMGAAGGNKVFCSEVWAMAGNYFAWNRLADALPSFGWRNPEGIILIVDDEGDDEPRIFRIAAPLGGYPAQPSTDLEERA